MKLPKDFGGEGFNKMLELAKDAMSKAQELEQAKPENTFTRQKLRSIDYVFLIGAPIIFFGITAYGLRRVIGPIPQPSPVQRIKDGEIKAGESMNDVLKQLGQPKSVTPHDDGSMTLTYSRTVADGDLQIEDGIISVDQTSHVTEAHVQRQAQKAEAASAER